MFWSLWIWQTCSCYWRFHFENKGDVFPLEIFKDVYIWQKVINSFGSPVWFCGVFLADASCPGNHFHNSLVFRIMVLSNVSSLQLECMFSRKNITLWRKRKFGMKHQSNKQCFSPLMINWSILLLNITRFCQSANVVISHDLSTKLNNVVLLQLMGFCQPVDAVLLQLMEFCQPVDVVLLPALIDHPVILYFYRTQVTLSRKQKRTLNEIRDHVANTVKRKKVRLSPFSSQIHTRFLFRWGQMSVVLKAENFISLTVFWGGGGGGGLRLGYVSH